MFFFHPSKLRYIAQNLLAAPREHRYFTSMGFLGNSNRPFFQLLLLCLALLLLGANKCSLSDDVVFGGQAARTTDDTTDDGSGSDDSGDSDDDAGSDDTDDDADGLFNLLESTFLLNPTKSDTDEDGFADGLEFVINTGDPLNASLSPSPLNQSRLLAAVSVDSDADLDGIGTAFERSIGTDHNDPDTDGDGYTAALELVAESDPLNASSRPSRINPPLADGIERFGAGPPDLDGDGLSDDIEALTGTSPTDRDSDDDGYSDGIEVIMGSAADDGLSVPAFNVLPGGES